jgi:hypothetical protein
MSNQYSAYLMRQLATGKTSVYVTSVHFNRVMEFIRDAALEGKTELKYATSNGTTADELESQLAEYGYAVIHVRNGEYSILTITW